MLSPAQKLLHSASTKFGCKVWNSNTVPFLELPSAPSSCCSRRLCHSTALFLSTEVITSCTLQFKFI